MRRLVLLCTLVAACAQHETPAARRARSGAQPADVSRTKVSEVIQPAPQFVDEQSPPVDAAAGAPVAETQPPAGNLAQAQVLEGLYQEARADVAAERWDAAAAKFDALATSAPAYRDIATLRRDVAIQQRRDTQLAAWYGEAIAAEARGDWPEAIAAFHQVLGEAPGYRDAASRLAAAEQDCALHQGLASARATLAAGHPQEAVILLETLARVAPDPAEAKTLLAQALAEVAMPRTLPRQGGPPAPVPARTTPPMAARLSTPAPAPSQPELAPGATEPAPQPAPPEQVPLAERGSQSAPSAGAARTSARVGDGHAARLPSAQPPGPAGVAGGASTACPSARRPSVEGRDRARRRGVPQLPALGQWSARPALRAEPGSDRDTGASSGAAGPDQRAGHRVHGYSHARSGQFVRRLRRRG